MAQVEVQLAIDLFLLAEEFNRKEDSGEAFELKMVFKKYMDKLSKSDQKDVKDYLDSVGA